MPSPGENGDVRLAPFAWLREQARHAKSELVEWRAVIRGLKHNPLVEYDRIVRQRLASRGGTWLLWLWRAVAFPLIFSAVIAGCVFATLWYHYRYVISHPWPPGALIQYGPFFYPFMLVCVVFLALMLPLTAKCTLDVMTLLSTAGRIAAVGAVLEDGIAISSLSDKELLAGLIATRLLSIWRLLLLFPMMAITWVVYGSLVNHEFNAIALPLLLLVCAVMLIELWLAALLCFLCYFSLSRNLPAGLPAYAATVTALIGQVGYWVWMYYRNYYCLVLMKGIQLAPFVLFALLNIVALAAALTWAQRSPVFRRALVFIFPAVPCVPYLLLAALRSGLSSDAGGWLNLDGYTLALGNYVFCYPYGAWPMLDVFSLHVLGRYAISVLPQAFLLYALFFVSQLVLVLIALHHALTAVHARRAEMT